MNDVIDVVISIFNWLYNTEIFNVPLLVLFTIPLVVGIIFKFMTGKKESSE